MKKFVLIIMLALFVAGNLTALSWGGVDLGKILPIFDCKD